MRSVIRASCGECCLKSRQIILGAMSGCSKPVQLVPDFGPWGRRDVLHYVQEHQSRRDIFYSSSTLVLKSTYRNLTLSTAANFVETFLGTSRGLITISSARLVSNSVMGIGIEVELFRSPQCKYIRGQYMKESDLLTGYSCGTDLYSITLQDSTTPNPICLMAKATSS
ncbi:hypothetical protein Tco_0089839 [Tanacetum coccineum]